MNLIENMVSTMSIELNADGLVFGGFWRRLAAVLIDFIAMLVPLYCLLWITRYSLTHTTDADYQLLDTIDSGITLIMWWLYYALFNSSAWQASLGKRALGLKIIDSHGQRLSFARASGRFFAEYLSALTLCIGYMMAGWTKRKRSLHDMIARTYVIHSSAA